MALSEAQKATLMEALEIPGLTEINFRLTSLTAAQETRVIDDIDAWDAIKDKHLKIAGGKDGVDLDNDRKRDAIIRRLRVHLMLTNVVEDSSTVRLLRA